MADGGRHAAARTVARSPHPEEELLVKRLAALAIAVTSLVTALAIPSAGVARPAAPHAHAANTVPNVTGLSLPAAEARVRRAGLRPKDVGGGIFGIIIKSDWDVCGQSPGPGSHVGSGHTVKLFVSRPGNC
jgi:beta-lactam-binding protein with PASTA domain